LQKFADYPQSPFSLAAHPSVGPKPPVLHTEGRRGPSPATRV